MAKASDALSANSRGHRPDRPLALSGAAGSYLSEREIWRVFIQITLALRYLHVEKRVIHRDLTPANVLVDM